MRAVRTIVVAAMTVACGGGDGGDDGGTGPEPNVLPTALYSVRAAYDQARNRLWDGSTWTRVSRSGPPARNWPALAYDARRQRVVLFGGDAGATRFADTWEWNGAAWTQINATGPVARTLHTLTHVRRTSRTDRPLRRHRWTTPTGGYVGVGRDRLDAAGA